VYQIATELCSKIDAVSDDLLSGLPDGKSRDKGKGKEGETASVSEQDRQDTENRQREHMAYRSFIKDSVEAVKTCALLSAKAIVLDAATRSTNIDTALRKSYELSLKEQHSAASTGSEGASSSSKTHKRSSLLHSTKDHRKPSKQYPHKSSRFDGSVLAQDRAQGYPMIRAFLERAIAAAQEEFFIKEASSGTRLYTKGLPSQDHVLEWYNQLQGAVPSSMRSEAKTIAELAASIRLKRNWGSRFWLYDEGPIRRALGDEAFHQIAGLEGMMATEYGDKPANAYILALDDMRTAMQTHHSASNKAEGADTTEKMSAA
jgi:hypothetical protein